MSTCREDFYVQDGNGMDGQATLCLPDPMAETGDGLTYTLWVRAPGGGNGNGGSATINSCYNDGTDTYCNTGRTIAATPGGPFMDFLETLLFFCTPSEDEANIFHFEPLFAAGNEGYYGE
ncbi:hypothetical protein ACA910_016498 [Epithemia clementina (nom. ined.)]